MVLAENQTEKKIKVLRTYNIGEFSNKEFEEFCKKFGIAWQKTTPYTPQKNGIAEIMNMTLMEKDKRTKLDSKYEWCIFIRYKDGLKGYKLWNPETRKVVYNRDVVFIGVKDVIKHEVLSKEPKKIDFDLKEEESYSTVGKEWEDEERQTLFMRIPVRERRQLERYSPSSFCSHFSLSITDDDPRTMREEVYSEDGKLWKEAMVDEKASLHKNEAWDLVELPVGRKPIGNKWVFKMNMSATGKVEKYKAQLVAKGYSQVPRIDFGDIFSPVSKEASIRLLLFVSSAFDFEVE
eukprot:PITA_02565